MLSINSPHGLLFNPHMKPMREILLLSSQEKSTFKEVKYSHLPRNWQEVKSGPELPFLSFSTVGPGSKLPGSLCTTWPPGFFNRGQQALAVGVHTTKPARQPWFYSLKQFLSL